MRNEPGRHHSPLPHFVLFLPRNQWGLPCAVNIEPFSHTSNAMSSWLPSSPPPPLRTSRERDLFPVCMLCEKHPKEIGEFFGLWRVKELVERRKEGEERGRGEQYRRVQNEKAHLVFSFGLLYSFSK